MINPTEYRNNCNYLTIAYSVVTELFTFNLKTPDNTYVLKDTPTCTEHDLEHLLYGLGYSKLEEDIIDNVLSIQQARLAMNNPLVDDKGKLKRKLTWEHPELTIYSWYFFLDEDLKRLKDEAKDFEVGFYFLPNKTRLIYTF